MGVIKLSEYDNSWYRPGRSLLWRCAWLFFGHPVLRSSLLPVSRVRVALLRAFGAKIGSGVVMQHGFKVKYPWHLVIGNNCWIGEDCWIDNLMTVRIGDDTCLSQGCYLCTGNHDWSDPNFGLKIASIEIGDGAWVGAKVVLAPGVVLGECAIAAAGSVITRSVPAFEIYAGNPGSFVKKRKIGQDVLEAAGK